MMEIVGLLLGGLGLVLGVFLGMLGDAPLARYAVARALRRLPATERKRYREEWEGDFVVLREQPLRLLLWAWGLTISTRALASELARAGGESAGAVEAQVVQVLPAAVASLPDSYALRMELERYGINDDRLRMSLLDRGVHNVVRWREYRIRDLTISHYFLRDEIHVPVGEIVVKVRRQELQSFSVWDIENDLVDFRTVSSRPL